ncbi:MAG: ATP-binding cassette domain-containing protein [Bacteroidetes bacterium]|nr:MAG: ATP-binding cassette domain-containing protein [Bacteroidota bacterium]
MARHKNTDTENIDAKRKIKRGDFQKAFRIYRFALPYKWVFIVGMLFLGISTLTSLSLPIFAGKFLDVATGKTSPYFNNLTEVTTFFALVLVVQSIVSFFRIFLFARVSEKSMADIRTALYQKIITLPVPFFEQRRVGELNSRLTSDVTQLQDTLSFTFAEFLRLILTVVLGTTYLLITSPRLTLFMFATFPVMMIVAIFFGRFIRKIAKQAQDELANSNVVVEETLQAIHVVKAFTNEFFELNRYRTSLNKSVTTSLKVATYRGLFSSFVILLLIGGMVAVLAYGALLVQQGAMSVGELTTFMFFSAFIGGSIGGMSEMYGQLQKTIGASERILEILEEEGEIAELKPQVLELPRVFGKIRYENVQFSYPTRPDIEVLKGVNISIGEGQKIALVGYSGAGKSTIVQLLGKYYHTTAGEITIDDKPLQQYDLTHLRQQIGIVPQEVILFGGTIRENIQYGNPQASETEVIEAAKQAYAWQFIKDFPEGMDTIVGERGVKLSGGQRQRIAIARAILKNPAILVLDEATSSLDAEAEQAIQLALDNLMQNRTTIIIAHRLATVRKADKIYVLDKGKIAEQGTHESLSAIEGGLYSNLVKLQFENAKMESAEVEKVSV